jgi:hypothetical protein
MPTTTFSANTKAQISRLAGNDWQGQPLYASKKHVKCSVIYFRVGQADVSIRADRSESKGKAEEGAGKVRILLPPKTVINAGDRVDLLGVTLRAIIVFPRISLNGKLHHKQVDLELWEE